MIRAYIGHDFLSRNVAIVLVRESSDGSRPEQSLRILDVNDDGHPTFRWDDVEPYAQLKPTLMLPDSEARAILDGLAAHYHGSSETQALRGDYDAERNRVDNLTGVLGGVLQTLAAKDAR